MQNISSLLGSSYTAAAPLFNSGEAICRVNGEIVACSNLTPVAGIAIILWLSVMLLFVVSIWKIFTKAKQPGWASIVPIYNIVVMLQIIKKPTWWVLLALIPFVNVVIGFIILIELAKVFGKGIGFTLGLIFLPIIFYPILAFGSSKYQPSHVEVA